MTSTDFSEMPKTAKRSASTMSFGAHRLDDRPASAIRAGASSMPAPWQSRGTSQSGNHHQYGAPVRSIADILTGPLRGMISSTWRKVALGGAIVLAVLILIF